MGPVPSHLLILLFQIWPGHQRQVECPGGSSSAETGGTRGHKLHVSPEDSASFDPWMFPTWGAAVLVVDEFTRGTGTSFQLAVARDGTGTGAITGIGTVAPALAFNWQWHAMALALAPASSPAWALAQWHWRFQLVVARDGTGTGTGIITGMGTGAVAPALSIGSGTGWHWHWHHHQLWHHWHWPVARSLQTDTGPCLREPSQRWRCGSSWGVVGRLHCRAYFAPYCPWCESARQIVGCMLAFESIHRGADDAERVKRRTKYRQGGMRRTRSAVGNLPQPADSSDRPH
ncbi:hypothetical protein EDB83DRAFT_2319678 [Lactarius deliciosus]|nr:hypothetical protein EDB83DRAFT_2319678 [Lactarius deliciosus]